MGTVIDMKEFDFNGIINWNQYYMNMVYLVAMRSKDKSTHYGAIIVDSLNRIISTGYNGFPRGINDYVKERQERPEKYYWFSHAEVNAIYNVDRSVRGCRLYTNGIPCSSCARGIVQAGIIKVITDRKWNESMPERWKEENERTRIMFEEADIKLVEIDFDFAELHKFMRGKSI